ncbi:transposase [Cystobacter fuscus]|uniref:Transposase n=2 Tax=Cystobacter fuscus TaxID=43 RepID=A0A250J4E0_9BACT|nr:transposase [Cystobacter fuscus]
MDERLGLTSKLAGCIPDARDPARVVHSRLERVRQRVYQMALGYEDCNDAQALRHDPALQVACDLMPHSGSPLSSQPTLCRLENAVDGPRCSCARPPGRDGLGHLGVIVVIGPATLTMRGRRRRLRLRAFAPPIWLGVPHPIL